jgi:DNA-binding MarR family transcriptional regulator
MLHQQDLYIFKRKPLSIIKVIAYNECESISAICKKLRASYGYVHKTLKLLEADDLVHSIPDGRCKRYVLTPLGHQVVSFVRNLKINHKRKSNLYGCKNIVSGLH